MADISGFHFHVEKANTAASVYVSGLPEDILGIGVALKEVFGRIGKIKEVILYRKKESTFKGDAVITYEDKGTAKNAVVIYNGTQFFGDTVNMKLVRDMEEPKVDITALLREEGHWHCRNCVLSTCSKEQAKCPTRQCPNGCGSAMHSCKLDEHLEHVCSEAHVPCSNAIYGCEELMRRGNLVTHLEHCSASIVMCRFSHDRMSVEFLGEKDCSPREPLLDEKLLLGDLAILQDRNRVIGCTVSLPLGTVGHYLKGDPSDQSSDQPRDLDIQCTVGIVTNASQSSHYHTKSLTPRKRTCVNVEVKIQHHYIKRPVLTKQCCAFSCNEIVRRDEFAAHWKTLHLDIQVDMPTIIERCPMHAYGCMHGEQRLVPNPRGSSLDYDQETDCLLLKCPETVTTDPQSTSEYATKIQAKQELALYGYEDDSDESFDVLGQLPVEILMAITEYLDSQSLWHLSLVNHYLRKVCLNVVKKRGIVYCQWTFDGATQGWICGPKIWSFSKVFRGVPSWSYTPTSCMGSHMMSCDHLKATVTPYEPGRWKIPDCQVVPKQSAKSNLSQVIST